MVDAQPEYEVDSILCECEVAVEDASLLSYLEDGTIVKHNGCPKLS